MDKSHLLVIIPSPGLGHVLPTLEFAHALFARNKTFSINILVISPAFTEAGSFTKTLSASHPSLNFIDIPQVDTSPLISTPPMVPEAFYSSYIELHKPHVKEAVEKLVLHDSGKLVRFVVDMFCTSMIDVAKELNSPCYTYFTSSAAFLGLIQCLADGPEFDENDSKSMVQILGYANPVPTSVLPAFFFHKDGHKAFSTHAMRIRDTKGVIVNTFAELEEYALSSFASDARFPPLYPVGPLLDVNGANRVSETKDAERKRVLRWLDEQEDKSVVFLCFGSMGCFKAEQVKEIADGLERTQVKFLWSVRKPPQGGKYGRPEEIDDPSEILPEGFLARTEGQGLICGWAPQINILAHKAIGGFVTHCGWNSILESIWFGVPTVAWPLYAEQQINAFYMVKDLGLSVELKMDYRLHQEELVSAEEVETAIKVLMSSDGPGVQMRKRVREMSERSRAAVAEGGSSLESIGTLIKEMLDE